MHASKRQLKCHLELKFPELHAQTEKTTFTYQAENTFKKKKEEVYSCVQNAMAA